MVNPVSSAATTLLAPGATEGSMHLPRRDTPLPSIDERIVQPESRFEVLEGTLLASPPADPPHAMQHFDLTYLLGAYVAPGYRGAVDMLTRTSPISDIAPDASIFSLEPDLVTGGRRLEEVAFEIASEQSLSVPTGKARTLIARGVRRVFCIVVKKRQVLEWSRETDAFAPLGLDAVIADRCLVQPLRAQVLLDATEVDNAVAKALLAKGNPVLNQALQDREQQGETRGELRGQTRGETRGILKEKAESVLRILETRQMPITDDTHKRIASCEDAAQLDVWFVRAMSISKTEELF